MGRPMYGTGNAGCLRFDGSMEATFDINFFELSQYYDMTIQAIVGSTLGAWCSVLYSMNGGSTFYNVVTWSNGSVTNDAGYYSINSGASSYTIKLKSSGINSCYFDHIQLEGINPGSR